MKNGFGLRACLRILLCGERDPLRHEVRSQRQVLMEQRRAARQRLRRQILQDGPDDCAFGKLRRVGAHRGMRQQCRGRART
jgi:hypothetical protein